MNRKWQWSSTGNVGHNHKHTKTMTDSVGKELFTATINREKGSGAAQSVTMEGGEKRPHDRIRWGNTPQRSITTGAEPG